MTLFSAPKVESQTQPGISASESIPEVPRFSVVSAKPNTLNDGRWRMRFTPDGYSALGVTVQKLIEDAYGIWGDDQLQGIPKWAKTQKYDIEAKVDENDQSAFSKLNQDQSSRMLQEFLADRFQLRVHYETKQVPAYALVLAKKGAKFKETPADRIPLSASKGAGGHITRSRPGQITEEWVSMPYFAKFLSLQVQRPVIDRTGLAGRYDLQLDWTPEDSPSPSTDTAGRVSAASTASGPSLFTALNEQLGLRLIPEKGTLEMLVIDHVELPGDN
jgi:uncharacterized protein (TIGR03435 family)